MHERDYCGDKVLEKEIDRQFRIATLCERIVDAKSNREEE